MGAASTVISGIKLAYDDTHYANITEVLTLDMRQGAVSGSTRWLDGAAGTSGAYPGAITGFQATNTDTTNTGAGGLKMMVIKYDKSRTNADTITFSSNDTAADGQLGVPFTKIVAVLGHTNGAANDHDIVTFTDTVLTLQAEAAAANNHITLLLE